MSMNITNPWTTMLKLQLIYGEDKLIYIKAEFYLQSIHILFLLRNTSMVLKVEI